MYCRTDLKASNPPLPRTDHTFVKYKESFIVYGGRDEMHIFSDVFEYKISKFYYSLTWIADNKWRYLKS